MFFVQVQSSSPPWRGAQRAGWLQCKSNFQLNFPHLRYTSLSVGTQSAGIVQLTCSLTKSPIKFPSVEGCPTCGVVTMQKHLPNPFEPARNSQLPTPNSQLPTPNLFLYRNLQKHPDAPSIRISIQFIPLSISIGK
jgi:hypothetical protein